MAGITTAASAASLSQRGTYSDRSRESSPRAARWREGRRRDRYEASALVAVRLQTIDAGHHPVAIGQPILLDNDLDRAGNHATNRASGMSNPAISTIDSRRMSASAAEFA